MFDGGLGRLVHFIMTIRHRLGMGSAPGELAEQRHSYDTVELIVMRSFNYFHPKSYGENVRGRGRGLK